MLRPAQLQAWPIAPCRSAAALAGLSRSPSPLRLVFVDGFRSALPPISSGMVFATALMTVAPAARVAILPPLTSSGEKRWQVRVPAAGQVALVRPRELGGQIGIGLAYASKRRCQSCSSCAPRSTAARKCCRDSSGTKNASVVGQPSARLVASTSSGPSGLPCASKVPALCGLRSRAWCGR